MLTMEDQLLKLDEAAKRLTISISTLRRLISTGEIESVRIGSGLRVRSTAIARYLARNTKPEDKN